MTIVAHRSDRNLDQFCIMQQRYSIGPRGELIPQPGPVLREILLRHPELTELPDDAPVAVAPPAGPPGVVIPPPEDDGEGDDGLERDQETSADVISPDPTQWSHKQLATALAPKHGKKVWSKPTAALVELYLEDMTSPT